MKRYSFQPCLWTLLLVASLALATPPTVVTPPVNPLSQPLERGDTAAVEMIETRLGAGPGMRAMDRAQLHYDIPQLLSAARECQSKLVAAGSADDVGTALYCSYIARSSALIEGDALAFLKEVDWVKTILFPALQRTTEVHPIFGTGLDSANLVRGIHATPSPSETWLAASKQLYAQPSSNSPRSHRPLIVNIKINGRMVPGIVELGSGSLRTPVTIVESTNDGSALIGSLKLIPLVHGYADDLVSYGGSEYRVSPSLYLANKLQVGPLVLHDIAIGVVRINYIPPGVYLGNSMWRRFGEVVISDNGVLLSRQSTTQCTPAVPMTFAANYHEFGTLVFPIDLNGSQRAGVLSLLTLDPEVVVETSKPPTPPRTNGADQRSGATKDLITIRVGAQSFGTRSGYIAAQWRNPFQVSIGAPVLDQFKVHLQLGAGSPSICLEPETRPTVHRVP